VIISVNLNSPDDTGISGRIGEGEICSINSFQRRKPITRNPMAVSGKKTIARST
jgi:hypothetical protein